MVEDRQSLFLIDPSGRGGPLNDGRHPFTIAPTGNGGRGFAVETRPWEPSDPRVRWRVPLHPWTWGLGPDRLRRGGGYSKANADASNEGLLLFPPKLNTLTLTNATTPAKAIPFDSQLFILGGRYMEAINGSQTVFEDKDFGASKACVDAAVFNNELIVAMGETEKIWKRSIGANISGTANAAVTSDNTTLTDTRLALTINAYVGATVTCNGKTMVVTSNTATVFTGASWSGGGNPGNGFAWSAQGTWTQATDATYAIALGLVGNKLYRAETKNRISNAITAPLTLASWAPSGTNAYSAGDTTFSVTRITDYGGVPWVFKADGVYAPDDQARFFNQVPQLARKPHADNGKGNFVAQGALWCPSSTGLYKITPGRAQLRGPEKSNRPDYRMWVRGGVEWGESIFLLVTDEDTTANNTMIVKMVKDETGATQKEYIYHEWCRLAASTKGYFLAMNNYGTMPSIVAGYGNNAIYIKVGRNGGRDVDDDGYDFGTAMSLETGPFAPDEGIGLLHTLVGVSTVLDYSSAGETLTLDYAADGGTYYEMLDTQEGGGVAPIALTENFQSITRYAPPNTNGQFFEVKFTGALTAAAGTARPEVREAWAFGYSRPSVTDRVTIAIRADNRDRNGNGIAIGRDAKETHRLFRNWMNTATVIEGRIPDYEESRRCRFLVTAVEYTETRSFLERAFKGGSSGMVRVELTRVDYAGGYAQP